MAKLSPMMEQYFEIKDKYKGKELLCQEMNLINVNEQKVRNDVFKKINKRVNSISEKEEFFLEEIVVQRIILNLCFMTVGKHILKNTFVKYSLNKLVHTLANILNIFACLNLKTKSIVS